MDIGSPSEARHYLPRRGAGDLWDRRTAAWRRRCELIRIYREALGEPISDALAVKIEAASEMRVVAERARAEALSPSSAHRLRMLFGRSVRPFSPRANCTFRRVRLLSLPLSREAFARKHWRRLDDDAASARRGEAQGGRSGGP